MRKTIVMNAKGGCGKTTVATNLASFFASQGYSTALFDHDPQGSSSQWLERRPENLPHIYGVAAYQKGFGTTRTWQMRIPADTEQVVIDTPAAVRREELFDYLKDVHTIIVPVMPSAIDVDASIEFLSLLSEMPRVRKKQARVCVIANRYRTNATPIIALEEFTDSHEIPLIARLRDAQSYLHSADNGIGVHEMPANRARGDRKAWKSLVAQLDEHPEASSCPTPPHSLGELTITLPVAEAQQPRAPWK